MASKQQMATPQTLAEVSATDDSWEFHLHCLSANTQERDCPTSPTHANHNLLRSARSIFEMCSELNSEEMVLRAFPVMVKLFQCCVTTPPRSQASTCLLLLAILQFFFDFGEVVSHDTGSSLRTFFRSCLSREFADAIIAEHALEFLKTNEKKLLSSFPDLLPQFYPLLLKLIAWNGERLEKSFSDIFPAIISSGSFLSLFQALVDLPILVVALEKVERNAGTLVGSVATIQKSAAPEMLLALMDEAYAGTAIEDRSSVKTSDDSNTFYLTDPIFLDLLKDEIGGISECHWTSPALVAALQGATSGHQSDRLKQAVKMAPRLLAMYFAVSLQVVNDSLLCALIPKLLSRFSTIFPDKVFSFEVRRLFLDFMLAVYQQYPSSIAILKKPILDRLGEAYDNPVKTELALHLCWAIGEHGAGGTAYGDVVRELFENLELLLYENLSSSRLGSSQESSHEPKAMAYRTSSQARLLCFLVTAIAKLATCHVELLPRARVALAKVARSRTRDERVRKRASNYLGLMNEPAICFSILGSSTCELSGPGIFNWNEGGSKMAAHLPFYLLARQEGPSFHDFSIADILPT